MMQDEPTLEQVLGCFKRKTVITAKKPVMPAGHSTRIGFASTPATAGGAGGVGAAIAGTSATGGQVAALHPYRGRYFAMSLPDGWKINDETEHGIDVSSRDGQEYVGFGMVLGTQMSPDAYTQSTLARYYHGVQVLGTRGRRRRGGRCCSSRSAARRTARRCTACRAWR